MPINPNDPISNDQVMLDAISKVAGFSASEVVLMAISEEGRPFIFRKTSSLLEALSLSDVLHGHLLKLCLKDPAPTPRQDPTPPDAQ